MTETILGVLHAATTCAYVIAMTWVVVKPDLAHKPYGFAVTSAVAVLIMALLRWGFGYAPWWWPVGALAVLVLSLLSWRAERERADRSSG